MIIISQDKQEIINFERITEIVVSENNICIADRIEQEKGYIVAEYKTNERAKEVFDELRKRILLTERFKALNSVGGQENMINTMYEKNSPLFIYEMPVE